MSNLNYNEIGQTIRINIGSDITESTPTLILLPQVGDKKEITSGVTIPTDDVTENGDTYYAGQYIEYTTQDGDLDYTGRWKKKAVIEYSLTNIEQTDYINFRVLP